MKDFRIHREAVAEFEESVRYYADRRESAGDEFRRRVGDAIESIRRTPALFSPYRKVFRKFIVKKFRFKIFFRDFPDHVWIAAIAHPSRREGYWLHRREQSS